jgi:hypothetical protein
MLMRFLFPLKRILPQSLNETRRENHGDGSKGEQQVESHSSSIGNAAAKL